MIRQKAWLVCFLFGLLSCSTEWKGEFGWSAVDNAGIIDPELSLLQEDTFRLRREGLYFFDYQTIWWIYRITRGSFEKEELLAALYSLSGSPEPVLIDLRRADVEGRVIRQFYDPLPVGEYSLKIAHKSTVVDEVGFTVVLPEGPGAYPEYDDLDEEEQPEDDLLRYSAYKPAQ
ncbi:MAG: hypothetical protein HS115_17125 [Spirochaetales bacterium]|nr:hypothetical protein [Spirochaetales bacterium]